jgi:DNA-binding Lrp family transcriptional regulator
MRREQFIVYILIQTRVGKEKSVVERANKFPGVTEIIRVYGEYDIVVRIKLDELSILDQTVTQIRRISGILKTSTLISMS